MSNALWVPGFSDLMATAHEFHDKAVSLSVEEAVLQARSTYSVTGGELPYDEEMRVRKAAREAAETAFADIPGLFQSFADTPDPARFTPVAESLRSAQRELAASATNTDPLSHIIIDPQKEFAGITTTGDFIDDWSGAAAREFKANYLDPLPAKVGGQFQIAAILAAAVEAEQAIWRAVRSDVSLILAKGLAALDHIGECTQAEWTITFTVIASIAAVAAIPLTGGASLALTGVGAAAQVTAALPVEGPSDVEYRGDTAFEVVDQVRQGASDLIARIGQAEQLIGERLTSDVAVVSANWREFVSERPSLGNATAADVTSPTYLGFAH